MTLSTETSTAKSTDSLTSAAPAEPRGTDSSTRPKYTLLAPVDGASLAEALDGPFHAIKQRWRDEVQAEEILRDPGMGMDEARQWTFEAMRNLSEKSFITAGFPSSVGGTGSHAESVANFEMMAMGDLSLTIKSGVQHGLFGGAITNLGTDWHHERFLPGAISCELPGCFAMTELGHGSDVSSIETTITWIPESGEFEVHSPTPGATKAYIGNAAQHGRMAAVFGQLWVDGSCEGVHTILVPIRDEAGEPLPGVTPGDHGHKGGLLGVDNGTIRFDHVRVPREMLLNRYGGIDEQGVYTSPIENQNARFFTMLGTLVRGRICVGGGAASATRRSLSIATRYALRRTQFRKPGLGEEITLLDYLTHQRKLLPNVARAYGYGFAMNEAAQALQQVMEANASGQHDDRSSRALETRAAALKAAQTRWANDTIQVCREACGGAGYMSANQMTLSRQDADIFATFEGDNTVLNQLVAKGLLLDYKRNWGEMDMRGTAQATAKMVGSAVLERTVARTVLERITATATRLSEPDLVASRGWHLEMFEERERHTVEGLARRMRNAAKLPKEEQYEAISLVGEHMLFAARAHTERITLEAFINGIEQTKDANSAALLNKVCDLFALSSIEQDKGWFLEHNRLSPARAKLVSGGVDILCGELRPHALSLVEGLGVPEAWLRADLLEMVDPDVDEQ